MRRAKSPESHRLPPFLHRPSRLFRALPRLVIVPLPRTARSVTSRAEPRADRCPLDLPAARSSAPPSALSGHKKPRPSPKAPALSPLLPTSSSSSDCAQCRRRHSHYRSLLGKTPRDYSPLEQILDTTNILRRSPELLVPPSSPAPRSFPATPWPPRRPASDPPHPGQLHGEHHTISRILSRAQIRLFFLPSTSALIHPHLRLLALTLATPDAATTHDDTTEVFPHN